FSANDVHVVTAVDSGDTATATVKVTHDVTLVFFWHGYFHGHHWLHHDALGFFKCVFNSKDSCHFESVLVGVHLVAGSVNDVNVNVHYFITCDDTSEHRLVHT